MFDTAINSVHSDMNYNPYTPPSSNEDSPQPYVMNPSPQNYLVLSTTPTFMDTSQNLPLYNFETQFNIPDQKGPYLAMIEQPTEKFRFRYKSEMAGTHGSLNGKYSDKARKQTYPTVELKNFEGPAIVRCSLYQYHASGKEQQPHAHRLIKKVGNEEVDDPHSLPVGGNEGYVAIFHSMGIIHTAKKNLIDELVRKKTLLKQEDVARTEGVRKLKKDEIVNIRHEAEEESKSINMNIVCLRFDALVKQNNILYPICDPIYSHSINNLKSALTGELKIVRMDHNSSPAKGNREIFMLVEKVTKKNIKVRFFELDEDDIETWADYGKFTELDVHHQYAIVFRTPPYRNTQISDQRKVFVELLRITDGSRSEAREFKYYPSPNYQPGMKRARTSCSYSTSGSWTSSADRETFVPATITEQNNLPSLGSAELDKMFNELSPELTERLQQHLVSLGSQDFSPDGPRERFNEQKIRAIENKISTEEIDIIDRVHSEFKSFLATKPNQEMINRMLLSLFQEHTTENGENTLHLLVKYGNLLKLRPWLEAIKKSDQREILNYPNKDGHTIGHFAVSCGNQEILNLTCRYSPDFSLVDNEGNTPLHLAIFKNSPLVMVDLLVRSKELTRLPINLENNDSLTAFHLAVSKQNLLYTKLLCEHGADVNAIDKKSGYNALHLSIMEQSVDLVRYLVEKTDIDLQCKNYQDITPYQMAKRLINDGNDSNIISICMMIETALRRKGLDTEEVYIKEEQESEDEEMECDFIECKPEKYTPEELKEMYKIATSFTPQCLREVSEILDASGKWNVLAQLLDMQHIIYTDMFKKAPSKSRQLLQSAEKECDIYEIRDFLENLEELDAVVAIDKMVLSMHSSK